MKKLLILSLIAASLTFGARAQYIVYDPTSNAQQIADQFANLAKYLQMINNQIQQITTLNNQLTQFENYEAIFGDPSQVPVPLVSSIATDLQSLEPIQNLETLVTNADGNTALTFNGSGLYHAIGTSFQTPAGQTIQRPANDFKPFTAIINTASNFVTVADNAAQRRASIKNQIAQTAQQLQNATTDAEVQKLQGVLTSLNGDLASTDAEVNQAVGSALVQDIQNRNDGQKQQTALLEQQAAEFHEAVTNYAANFSLLTETNLFPTP